MLTIPVAHTLVAVRDVFGKIKDVASVVASRRKKIYSRESDSFIDMNARDQVGVQAVLQPERRKEEEKVCRTA